MYMYKEDEEEEKKKECILYYEIDWTHRTLNMTIYGFSKMKTMNIICTIEL